MPAFSNVWKKSKLFRVILIAAAIWFGLRLIFQVVYTAGFFTELTGESGLPGDLPVYMGGAERFAQRQAIYPQDLSDSTYHYPYSPPFAMLSGILLWLPARWTAMLALTALVLSYALIFLQWMKIFRRLGLDAVEEKMVWVLPVWMIFAPFWGGISYLNIGILVVLVTTLLIRSILEERLSWSVLLLTFLLISKVMWAFPLALPLLLGRRRYFFKLLAFSAAAYLALVGLTVLAAGPAYVYQQYGEYVHHLGRLTREFPWHVIGTTPYFGYNHSVKQTIIFLLGTKPWVLYLATVVKLALLSPLAWIGLRLFIKTGQIPDAERVSPSLYADLTLSLYLASFLWLDIIWELLLGIVVFTYLLAVLENRWQKKVLWYLFLPYAFLDVIRLVSYLVGGEAVFIANGEYIITDPSIYFPLALLILLVFYFVLVKRLWPQANRMMSISDK